VLPSSYFTFLDKGEAFLFDEACVIVMERNNKVYHEKTKKREREKKKKEAFKKDMDNLFKNDSGYI